MASYEEAPALPREPTAISIPTQPPAQTQSPPEDPSQVFAPPPKFPSMTDVALQNAITVQSTTTTTSSPPTDIQDFIQTHTVLPGTGAKKAEEAAGRIWTTDDQLKLDQLLNDGRDVYVPADVSKSDLPQTYHASYFPVKPTDAVNPPPDAAWQQVISSPDSPILPATARAAREQQAIQAGPTAAAVAAALDAEPIQQSPEIHSPPSSSLPPPFLSTREAPPQKKADVYRTIFGGSFETVPITRRGNPSPLSPVSDDDEHDPELATTHEVKLPSESHADVNVTDDYGLKGGHDSGVHDAAFMDHKTLVTAGSDGKVCIWDMPNRAVRGEFLPYQGEPVTMVYPMPEEDGSPSRNLLTLSKGRLMRIWAIDETLAFLLRSIPIPESDNDLYMSVPVISKELKERAAAAAVAAAVSPTVQPDVPEMEKMQAEVDGAAADPGAKQAEDGAGQDGDEEEEENVVEGDGKDERRFSLTRFVGVLRRNSSSRKAVAS